MNNGKNDQTPQERIRAVITARLAKYAKDPKVSFLAYTQTFKTIHAKRPKGQFNETAPSLTKKLARSTDFIIIPEWRLTSGDIHYHGIIVIHDRLKWQCQTLPYCKMLGYTEVKKIFNLQKWIDYFIKEAEIAEGIIGINMPIYGPVVKEELSGTGFSWDVWVHQAQFEEDLSEEQDEV